MSVIQSVRVGLVIIVLLNFIEQPAAAAGMLPRITSLTRPLAGNTTIFFHGDSGPFRVQMRSSLAERETWLDLLNASVTEVQPGIFMALIPNANQDLGFYRVVSEKESVTDLKGWTILVQVSVPANGKFFVKRESPIITVTILDTLGRGVHRDDFSVLHLYLYGPQDPHQSATAAKLLNASVDRAKNPHHYIDLKWNPAVQVAENVLTYRLQPVSDEAEAGSDAAAHGTYGEHNGGTYTVSVWARLASDESQQIMKFANLQIGTDEVERSTVVKTKCATCHEGPASGKMYFYHSKPGFNRDLGFSPLGNWSLDYEPVTACKSCHNNDGFAAYPDASAPLGQVADPIVRRIHGIHMGKGLKLPFNNDPKTGDFRQYIHVRFPADARNCTACHADDRWREEAHQLACGACHDNTWFGEPDKIPAGMKIHPGGPEENDSFCRLCHTSSDYGFLPIARSHRIDPPVFQHQVSVTLTPPNNGKFYAAGEKPIITIKITDAITGTVIDPRTVLEPLIPTFVQTNEWWCANLFVSGPRAQTVPVLTTAADHPVANQDFANNDLRVRRDSRLEDPRITRTAAAIAYQLDDVSGLKPGTYTVFVEAMQRPLGGWVYVNFQVGTETVEPMVAANCSDCHGHSTQHSEFFAFSFAPDLCKNCHDYFRQTPGKKTWTEANKGFGATPLSRLTHGIHFGNYLDKPDEIHPGHGEEHAYVIFPMDVRNCIKCHSESTSWNEKPSRLACLACHDSDTAIAHANLMTFDPTPQDSYSGDEVETCEVCHGKNARFAASVMHSISNPYVPPYPRALRGQ